jgi:hypothetical protein
MGSRCDMTYAALREFLEDANVALLPACNWVPTGERSRSQADTATTESGSLSFLPLFQTCTVKGQPTPEGSQEKEK